MYRLARVSSGACIVWRVFHPFRETPSRAIKLSSRLRMVDPAVPPWPHLEVPPNRRLDAN
jgi:hypothetical protein